MNIRRIAGLLAALSLLTGAAHAIEAPKPQAPSEEAPQQPPPEVNVTPTDERAFYEKIQRVTAFRSLRGLKVPADVIAPVNTPRPVSPIMRSVAAARSPPPMRSSM